MLSRTLPIVHGRALNCKICADVTEPGKHLVTKMLRGPFANSFPHMNCALQWYLLNPRPSESLSAVLNYKTPSAPVCAFMDAFVAGEAPSFNLKGTAGCGKTTAWRATRPRDPRAF